MPHQDIHGTQSVNQIQPKKTDLLFLTQTIFCKSEYGSEHCSVHSDFIKIWPSQILQVNLFAYISNFLSFQFHLEKLSMSINKILNKNIIYVPNYPI
ncbi:unnamed protein product [Paramecium primaurelia]|uniref:Uncharacterized protein n=1 Tax=Paramecium primaurelia TaxID=5886 RepID=A0A8S1KXZ3_PARPR|nr:unnamed protein product [Paramecium primaurelia]